MAEDETGPEEAEMAPVDPPAEESTDQEAPSKPAGPKRTPIFRVEPGEPELTVATERNEFGRVTRRVKCAGPEAASHWDVDSWRDPRELQWRLVNG